MGMRNIKIGFMLTLIALVGYSQNMSRQDKPKQSILGSLSSGPTSFTKEMVLGNILKGTLENMHLSKKKMSDQVSQKAFDLFLERLDYGKQFLLQKDVEYLKKYHNQIDDQVVSGNLRLLQDSSNILKKRIAEVKTFVEATLKKKMTFENDEALETDSKKRKFVKTMDELKERWRKILKYEILNKVVDLTQEQNQDDKDKKKKAKSAKKDKNKKPEKKLTKKEINEKAVEKVQKSYTKIFARLMEDKKDDRLDKFYNSVARVFDPHTHYLIPEEKEDFDIDMSGKLEGIGALLREEGSYIKVERIIPGSASWRGKELKAEDIILKVGQGEDEPVDIVDMSLRDAVKLIRGKKGTEVRLTVKTPDGIVKVVPITRDVVEIEESYVKSTLIEDKKSKKKIGYILVPKFYRDFSRNNGRNCSDDVRTALVELKKKGIDGVILDLRNNSGGALEDARRMAGWFIPKGPIVQVKDLKGQVEVLSDSDSGVVWDGPLVVMINQFSASASEIVAAALQDYGRALIVGGEHSHGKGTVQAVLDLDAYVSPLAKRYSPLGALKITIQMFYRITGGSTQFNGVTPDIIFPDTLSYLESGEKYLDYAIPWDKVEAAKFKKWKKKLNIKGLREKSEKRVSSNPRFKQIKENYEWLKERKNNTLRTLNFKKYVEYREEIKKQNDKNKEEEAIENIEVVSLDDFKKAKDKEVAKEKFEEFKKALNTDPYIEETLFIFQDMIKS